MSITIKPARNGWLLVYSEEGEQDQLHVFSHEGEEKEEAEAFQALLYTILDVYGPTSSRYSAHRIYVTVKPGDKHKDYEDDGDNSEA